jgi:hypothetical protein
MKFIISTDITIKTINKRVIMMEIIKIAMNYNFCNNAKQAIKSDAITGKDIK